MKKLFSALLLSVSITIGFSFTPIYFTTCTAPQNVAVTSLNGGNISFDWDDCMGGCTQYLLKYYRQEDSYSSGNHLTSSSTFSFSNLPDGTYDFYFATVCDGQISPFIIVEENISN
jgi:hypothetical protein